MADFPLAQWFDLTKAITRNDRRIAEAQIALWAHKDGLDPASQEIRQTIAALRAAAKAHNVARLAKQKAAQDNSAKFWAELQPLTLVSSKEEAIAAIPAVLDLILRYSDGSGPNAGLLHDVASELSVVFVDAEEYENCIDFAEACNAAFDEVAKLIRAESARRGIAS